MDFCAVGSDEWNFCYHQQDFQEAAKWFRMAAEQGDDVAQSYLQEIEGFLKDDDVLLTKNPYYLFFHT